MKSDKPHAPFPKVQYVFLNSPSATPGLVLCDDETGGVVGLFHAEERLEEKSGHPPTPATLPRHVCETGFWRASQERIRSPAPLGTSEVGEGTSPRAKCPRGRKPCPCEEPASVLAAMIFRKDTRDYKDQGYLLISARVEELSLGAQRT
jgi:hypothetical protein